MGHNLLRPSGNRLQVGYNQLWQRGNKLEQSGNKLDVLGHNQLRQSGNRLHVGHNQLWPAHLVAEIARYVQVFHMSSGWFDYTEPSLTTSLYGKKVSGRVLMLMH